MQVVAEETQRISLPLLGFTFMLAFCSIVYELLLGQTLSAFLGNTVLRYSVTIGLYMFSMGIGALLAGERILARPALSLQYLEIALAVLGGISVPLVFLIDLLDAPVWLLSIVAHLLIIVIGLLSGLEIPLLIEVRSEVKNAASRILGVDYIGAFVGTVAFALWFYPKLGIFATAIFTASVNALVGLLLPLYVRRYQEISISQPMMIVQGIILLVLLVVFLNYPAQVRIEFADGEYNADDRVPASVYTGYFGSGMSSVVFQELREARALAYSASARYGQGSRVNDQNLMLGAIGTQGFQLLLNNLYQEVLGHDW